MNFVTLAQLPASRSFLMTGAPGGRLYGSVDDRAGSELREVESRASTATPSSTQVHLRRARAGEESEVVWNRGYLLFEKGQAHTWRAAVVKSVIVAAILASLGTILAETIPTACVAAIGLDSGPMGALIHY